MSVLLHSAVVSDPREEPSANAPAKDWFAQVEPNQILLNVLVNPLPVDC